ncbi:MAG: DUF4197 domain-containing protein [Saprospiraceae bacterium]
MKLKLIIATIFLLSSLSQQANAQFGKLLNDAKKAVTGSNDSDQVGLGLKEALNVGVEEAVKSLSATNGYLNSPYKILIPEDAQKVIDKVKMIPGFENVEQKLVEKMNAAAELAAKEATPIFVDAIKKITFKDAVGILNGGNGAATQYLETNTRSSLSAAFLPIIRKSLDEVNARTYWKSVVSAYNGIPFVKKMNPELDQYVDDKALDGMFSLIEKKEDGIRNDVNQRTSPLLKDVFGKK